MKNLVLPFVFLILLLFLPLAVSANPTPKLKDNQAWSEKAENYLNELRTARARFVQTTNDGRQLVGTFYLDRPGKLRFEYDPPVDDFVVADGIFIYFYDSELKEQSNAPIGQTLADFLLRREITLNDELEVKSIQRAGGLLQIQVLQSEDPDAGSLTLGFTENPFALKKWRIVDGQGLVTEIELFYLKTGITHPSGLFVYRDPNPKPVNR
ncbi:MAG: outer membrane lipoprotein carrier protein LolA [Alphaproteobacteria bacterium]|nr:outer membrane lipoprotein carrier protein LolA [Alphaproteobacteria bacterium]